MPISPSSLEYQLTAHLLNYNHRSETPSASGVETRARSKSRTRPHQHRRRRDTINRDARIDSKNLPTNKGTGQGHRHFQSSDRNLHKANASEGDNEINTNYHITTSANTAAATPIITLAELTPTPLLGSTPSSPTGIQAPPALTSPYTEQQPLPKNISIPLPTLPPSPPLPPLPPKSPRSLIAHYFPRSLQPPPPRHRTNFYPKGPSVAPAPFKTPTFGPASLATSDNTLYPLPSTSSSFPCIPAADLSCSSTVKTNDLPDSESVPTQVQPSPSIATHGNLTSANRAQVSINTRQPQPVRQRPEIVVSTPSSEPSSANTSRDLEMVIKEIAGQLQACRSTLDSLSPTTSAWGEKPLPQVCCEKGARYWVFRDQDGIVFGPYFFLLGHLCPVLWWIGCVYPRTVHPDDLSTTELGKAVETTPQEDMFNHSLTPWLQQPQDQAMALFEQRLQHDRKVLRFELDQRWRRMNLIWSLGSFVLAVIIIAFVIGLA
ncbi:hypothetical protein BGZ51_005300 [Haplosporangium sp. Z 767]|nr:hypothetical protein BGZ51_005300 [Haplosporangium sp. Z 767]KAF9187631.1 hypothetical protein BGZ50_001824 [Haplosporangium sp. Z 11]